MHNLLIYSYLFCILAVHKNGSEHAGHMIQSLTNSNKRTIAMASTKLIGYIYKVTNLTNGKIYIGQHDGSKRNYYASGVLLNKAIKKHGKSLFERTILVKGILTQEQLDTLEKDYISLYNSFYYTNPTGGYNLTIGGQGIRGMIQSADARHRMSINSSSQKRVVQFDLNSIEVARYATIKKAHIATSIVESSISRACTRKYSSRAGDYLWLFEEEANKGIIPILTFGGRCVAQYDMDGMFITTHHNIEAAAQAIGCNSAAIRNQLSRASQSAGGYQWRYVEGKTLESIEAINIADRRKKAAASTTRKVIELSLSGSIVAVHDSSLIASRLTSIEVSTIRRCCRGDVASVKGRVFKYECGTIRRNNMRKGNKIIGQLSLIC